LALEFDETARYDQPVRRPAASVNNGVLMSDIETIEVESKRVGCDGGGTLGHPLVYLEMGDKTEVVCPYCSRTYRLREGAEAASDH